jgi:hypothetical protein
VSVLLPLPKRGPLLARILLHFQIQILLPMYQNDSIGRNSNFEKLHWPNSTFLTAKPDWLRSPQTYDKRTFLGVARWHFLLSELCPQNCQSIGFHSETPNCETPINLTADGCSVQAHAFECCNCTHTAPLFPLAMLFTAESPRF